MAAASGSQHQQERSSGACHMPQARLPAAHSPSCRIQQAPASSPSSHRVKPGGSCSGSKRLLKARSTAAFSCTARKQCSWHSVLATMLQAMSAA